MIFICYPKCTTCQKAQKWLDENGISYTFRDIKMENPTYEELSVWHQRSGLPLKKFFNTPVVGRRRLRAGRLQGSRVGEPSEKIKKR